MSLRPVVLSGPSGSGKSTLLNLLFKEFPKAFGFSVSHTTRNPRPGELNGKHYHFISKEEMEKEIKEGKFIEYATFSGNLYGTSKSAVQDVLNSNRICLLDIDEQGVKSMKSTDINPLYVFIGPPSLEVLRERLTTRGTESDESIERRMATAISAIQYSQMTDVYDVVIINEVLENAFAKLKEFLLKHFSTVINCEKGHDAAEIPEASRTHLSNGHAETLQIQNGDCSITEISLSPVKVKPPSGEDAPAVVAIDTVIDMSDAPVLTNEGLNKNNNLIITDRSSAVVNMDVETTDNSVVCGRNWCNII